MLAVICCNWAFFRKMLVNIKRLHVWFLIIDWVELWLLKWGYFVGLIRINGVTDVWWCYELVLVSWDESIVHWLR